MTSTSSQSKPAFISLILLLGAIIFAGLDWAPMVLFRPFSTSGLQWISLVILGATLYQQGLLKHLIAGFSTSFNPQKTCSATASSSSTQHPFIPALLVLILSALSYLVGAFLSLKTLFWGSVPVCVISYLWLIYGTTTAKRYLPYVLFSFFLLPDFPIDFKMGISLPLQALSTKLTVLLVSPLIPISALGNVFYIEGNAFEVTLACSGLNTWVGFLFAGFLWLLFQPFTLSRLVYVSLAAPILALLTNTTRLWLTAIGAFYIDPDTAIRIHTNLDFILFPAGLLLFFWIAKKQTPTLTVQSENDNDTTETDENTTTNTLWGRHVLAIVLIGTSLFGAILLKSTNPTTIGSLDIPEIITTQPLGASPTQWQATKREASSAEEAILGADIQVRQEFQSTNPDSDNKRLIWVTGLQSGNSSAIHNVYDSLLASGAKPVIIEDINLTTDACLASLEKSGKPTNEYLTSIHASRIQLQSVTGEPYEALLWYQWRFGSASNRWKWYLGILGERLRSALFSSAGAFTPSLPAQSTPWRLIQVTTPASNKEQLIPFAEQITCIPFGS